jgi:hypothetical protein
VSEQDTGIRKSKRSTFNCNHVTLRLGKFAEVNRRATQASNLCCRYIPVPCLKASSLVLFTVLVRVTSSAVSSPVRMRAHATVTYPPKPLFFSCETPELICSMPRIEHTTQTTLVLHSRTPTTTACLKCPPSSLDPRLEWRSRRPFRRRLAAHNRSKNMRPIQYGEFFFRSSGTLHNQMDRVRHMASRHQHPSLPLPGFPPQPHPLPACPIQRTFAP